MKTSLSMLRDVIAITCLCKCTYDLALNIYWEGGIIPFLRAIKASLFRSTLSMLTFLFPKTIGDVIDLERSRALDGINRKFMESLPSSLQRYPKLPLKGLSIEDFKSSLNEHMNIPSEIVAQSSIMDGLCSGAVYGMNDDIKEASLLTIRSVFYSNPLHPELFPSLRKMEGEIISMTLDLFNATLGGTEVGSITSGGTESILLACLAYRDWGRDKKGIPMGKEEIIISNTAHAAFYKAEKYFGIKLIVLPPDPLTGMLRPSDVKRSITSRTVAIVGSAPSFSIGIIDPIEEMSTIALESGVGLHVDCCLGSFLIPFLKGILPFDFRVPGVTSISCDPHKYGQTGKGISVLMWKRKELQHYQYYTQPSWTGGVYASPTLAGSRPGALVGGAWSSIIVMGRDGYQKAAKYVEDVRKEILKGMENDSLISKYLEVIGHPLVSVIAFRTAKIECGGGELMVYELNDSMSLCGWHLNCLQNPAAVHLAITSLTNSQQFINDLRSSLRTIIDSPSFSSQYNTTTIKTTGSSSARIYGTMQKLPDHSLISEITKEYLDLVYKIN